MDFLKATPQSVAAEFQEGGCGVIFIAATRDALVPFTLSTSTAGEPIAGLWGAQQFNATLRYAAARPNYLGFRGLIYPMRSGVFRAGRKSAGLKAGSGALVGLNLAIYQGIWQEGRAYQRGECR